MTRPRTPAAGRRRVFTIIMLATPLVLLTALEVTLRLAGYGPDLSLFTTETIGGRTYTVMNQAVKGRYFARVPFNPSTSPDFFRTPKPPGTFRIFCLGGSTTVGYPYWYNGAFSTFLRDRLRALFPDRSIEVINIGMTATNSHTVNDMAAEVLAEAEPDLLVVYDGHNEFYGALGAASNESVGGRPWVTRLYLRAIRFRTALLLRDLITAVLSATQGDAPVDRGFTMMERLASGQEIPLGSPLFNAGLAAYRENLEDLLEMCRREGVPVLLGAQVSNLRDLPPFVSRHPEGFDAGAAQMFEEVLRTGDRMRAAGDAAGALAAYARAVKLDSTYAGARYRLGRMLDTLGRRREAEAEYRRARDLDQLRFRMSSAFNDSMRDIAAARSAGFVDMEEVFRAVSRDSLIGNDLLVEHLHPNARGYFLMGRAYAAAMRERGVLAGTQEWALRDTVDDDRLWQARPLTELDERVARRRTEILMAGWPFGGGVPVVEGVPPGDTLGLIAERVVRGEWNWLQAQGAAAEFHLARGERARAEAGFRTIVNQLPLLDVRPHLMLARLYLDDRRFAEARAQLLLSLEASPTILAYRSLADLSSNAGEYGEAVGFYRKTFTFPQSREEQIQNGYLLARAAARAGDTLTARQEVLRVLALQPDFQPAAALLASLGSVRRETP